MDFIESFKAAKRAAAPLVSISTPDPAQAVRVITEAVSVKDAPAIFQWDVVQGIKPHNKEANDLIQKWVGNSKTENPVEALKVAVKMPVSSILFFHNAHLFLNSSPYIQGIWNLRDIFKENKRMLVLLSPGMNLPEELKHDVIALVEPLPNAEELTEIVIDAHKALKVPVPNKEGIERQLDAVSGLSAFSAETVCYMSMQPKGMNVESLWERKRQEIEHTKGLSVWRGDERFADIGGCNNVKEYLNLLINGEEPARGIVFIDEIEKSTAGASGSDLSGTSTEMVGGLLTYMEDKKANGILFVGVSGGGKSAIAKACGNEAGIPTIQFNISEMKGPLVGQSNQALLGALRVVEAVTQNRTLFIATSNSVASLSPELRRRFNLGTFYFDLPDKDEQLAAWKIWMRKLGIKEQTMPDFDGWTGNEIKQCCYQSYLTKKSLREASAWIVPVSRSGAKKIEELRFQANGCFISASYSGPYVSNPDAFDNMEKIRKTPRSRRLVE